MEKNMTPTNGIVEPDFLEYLKKTFKKWQQLHAEGVTLGGREIAKLTATVQGAKLNARFGFEAITHRGLDDEGQDRFTLMIYKNREAVETEKPLYHFTTPIYRYESEDQSMGFMDGFTSDGTVDMKHTEYYNLMREATKAELIGNAVKADVPGFYIQAMITGKKPEFLNTLDAEEESTGFHAEYEQITGAVVTIFEAWMKENGVESTAASLHRLIDTLAQNRIEELRTIKVNQEEHREQIKAAFEEMEKTMGAMAKMPPITVRMDFGSKKDQAAAVEPKESKGQAVDCWSCDTCGHHTGLKCDADKCKECEDGSNYTPEKKSQAAGERVQESEDKEE